MDNIMNFDNVKILLEKQYNALVRLYEAAKTKQLILIQYNQEKFDALINEEEMIVAEISYNEKERFQAISLIKKHLPENIGTTNISEIIKNKNVPIEPQNKEEIEILTANIREIAKNIKIQNEKNLYLINASSKFLKELITTVMSENKKNVLDRRM